MTTHEAAATGAVAALVERIRSEADLSARVGQCHRLHAIADDLAALAPQPPPSAREGER